MILEMKRLIDEELYCTVVYENSSLQAYLLPPTSILFRVEDFSNSSFSQIVETQDTTIKDCLVVFEGKEYKAKFALRRNMTNIWTGSRKPSSSFSGKIDDECFKPF